MSVPVGSPPGTRQAWGFGDVGWLLLWIVVCGVGAVAVSEWRNWAETALLSDVVFAVALLGPLTVVPVVVARTKGSGWRTAYDFRTDKRSLLTGVAAGVVAIVAVAGSLTVVERLVGGEVTASTSEDLASATGAGFVILLLIGTLWAPIAEEMSFRGLLWGSAAKRGWRPLVATVVSALPFALIHVEPLRTVPLLISGLILGVARQWGGLSAAMLAHLIINGAAATATVIGLS